MTAVYIVMCGEPYEGGRVLAVFALQCDAEAYLARISADDGDWGMVWSIQRRTIQ